MDTIPADIRTSPEWAGTLRGIEQKYKTPDEIARGLLNTYRSYGQKIEGMIRVPDANAAPEEREAFQRTIRQFNGVPEKPEDYQHNATVKDTSGADIPVGLDSETDGFVRQILHRTGLGNDAYTEIVRGIYELNQQSTQKQTDALRQQWGAQYDERVTAVQREIERVSDPALKAMLTEMSGSPALQQIIDYFLGGRREEGIPSASASPGPATMTAGEAREKFESNAREMYALDRNSEKYKQLDLENDRILAYLSRVA